MVQEKIFLKGIPAIVWGRESEKVYIHVHGKMSRKEYAQEFAAIAQEKGYQTISFDLPRHGARQNSEDRCDIWNGIRDLAVVGDYAFDRWKEVSLFACSLGAFFSLHAYQERPLRRCLFQSPIVDMEYLIRQMMFWFDVSEERLFREQEVDTPIDVLSWDYYQYVKAHPITNWTHPTAILFAGKDDLQSLRVMEAFSDAHGCALDISEESAHPFMEESDYPVVRRWMQENA